MTEEKKDINMERSELLLLGRIDGKLDGISEQLNSQDQRLDKIDDRLRSVEQKAAINGAVSGSVVSVGMALLIEGAKQWLSTKGIK